MKTQRSKSPYAKLPRVPSKSQSLLPLLARRIPIRATWDQLVLPARQMNALCSMIAQVRPSEERRVFALFAGPDRTGKTMAAQLLARELQMDLYCVDLAVVVSKYIGETEKNFKRLFDAAEAADALLLFDEADALFGKRSEVKDSQDRYANLETSYLVRRLETYRGVVILTTTRKTHLDPAILRRVHFVVSFPLLTPPGRRLLLKTLSRKRRKA